MIHLVALMSRQNRQAVVAMGLFWCDRPLVPPDQSPELQDMMPSRLSWVELPFPGRLTVIPRPHPDTFDWLRAQGVDLVVMGAKGHSKVELLLLGSVTEHFLGINSRVPTLVVK